MKGPRPLPIGWWLGATALVVSLGPALLLAGFMLRDLSLREEERAADRLAQVAHAASGEIRRFLDAQVVHLTEVSIAAAGPASAFPSPLGEQLALHRRANPVVQVLLLVDREGRVALADPADSDLVGTDLSGHPWWRAARETRAPTWSEVTVSPHGDHVTCTLVVPGEPWTVVGYLDLGLLGEIAARVASDGPVAAAVLDRTGAVLAGLGPRDVEEHASLAGLGPVVEARARGSGSGVVTLGDQRQVVGAATVPEVGWIVLVSEPEDAVLARPGGTRVRMLLVLALGVAVALAVAGRLAVRIARATRDLAVRARALAEGRPGPRAPVEEPPFRELHDLTASFDTMAAAVRDRERDLRRILDTALDAYWMVDTNGRILDANPAASEMSGYSRAELLAMTIADLARETSPELVSARIRGIVETGSGRFDTSIQRKDGAIVRLSVSVRHNPAAGGRLVAFLRDVTDRRLAQEALEASEAEYRDLIQNLQAGVVVHAPDTRIVLANTSASKMLGLSLDQMQGRSAIDPHWRFVREDGSTMPLPEFPVNQVLATGRPVVNLVLGIDRPATRDRAWVQVNAFPVTDARGSLLRVVVTFVDITARVRSEADRAAAHAQLALASRMAAMGTLVAGASHEINNPLAATIAGQGHALDEARTLLGHLTADDDSSRPELREGLDELIGTLEDAQEGAQRVAQIVRDLTALGSPNPVRTRLRLADAARDALRWVPAMVTRVATVTVEDLGAPDVAASPGQVVQVIVNLVTNAAKATPEGGSGRILVRVGPGSPRMARLEVIDHGTGIDPALRERIFEPFFTTRPVGPSRGTGLGLSICHSIVTAHGGTITVESTPGAGSTFRIELPTADSLGAESAPAGIPGTAG